MSPRIRTFYSFLTDSRNRLNELSDAKPPQSSRVQFSDLSGPPGVWKGREWPPRPSNPSGGRVQGASASTPRIVDAERPQPPSVELRADSGSRGKMFAFSLNSLSACIRTFHSFSAESKDTSQHLAAPESRTIPRMVEKYIFVQGRWVIRN